MTFANRVAVVTGGAGRVGRPLGEKLASAGVAVAVVDINAEGAEAEAEKIRQSGGKARGYGMDIQSTESVQRHSIRTERYGMRSLFNGIES